MVTNTKEIKPLNDVEQKRFKSLASKVTSLKGKLYEEFLQLKDRSDETEAARKSQIADVKKTLKLFGYKITDLFTKGQVTEAAIHHGLIEGGKTAKSGSKVKASDADTYGVLFIEEKKPDGKRGVSFKFGSKNVDVAWKNAGEVPMYLYKHNIKDLTGLKKLSNAEGKEYWDTEEGKLKGQVIVDLCKKYAGKKALPKPKSKTS